MKVQANTVRQQAAGLLRDWCDGLLRYQLDRPDVPEWDGGLLCPACKMIHGRCGEAVYPLLCAAAETNDGRYLTAARKLFRWSTEMLCDDGSLYNDANSPWRGTTVFYAIALHDALYHHGGLLTGEERTAWRSRLRFAGEWLYDNLTPGGSAYLNYYAANACAMALLGRYFDREDYLRQARKLSAYCFSRLGQCGLLTGEGHPHDARSPKGCAAIDIGYNAEETLPCLLRCAETLGDELALRTCRALFRSQLQWMLPDGAWDDSLGTRTFKWTYWGSRTTDGCEDALLRLGQEEPVFAEAALRRLRLLREYTHNGLLSAGKDLPFGEPTCLHHTFCRAKTAAAILNGEACDAAHADLPAETADGIVFYSELAAFRLVRGGWIADISANDFQTRGGGHASGGALSLLWHRDCGPIVAVGMADYAVNEPFNQQQTTFRMPHRSPCPRVETEADGKRWGQHYDYGADLQGEEKDGALRVHADAYLCDENHVRKEAAGFCTLDYELTEQALTVRGRVSPSLADSAAYILPVISQKAVISAECGTVEEDTPIGFNLNPGFCFTEYRVKPDRTGCFEVRITPRSTAPCAVNRGINNY